MIAEEIKQAINQGFRVYWANKSYQVIKGKGGLAAEYLIKLDLCEGKLYDGPWLAACTEFTGSDAGMGL